MIGQITTGKSATGALRYIHSKEAALSISSNFLGDNWQVQALEFNLTENLKPNVEKSVYHISLSLPHSETLSPEQWYFLTLDYLDYMGFSGHQYATAMHRDTEHQHIHIVANRIGLNATLVDTGYDYYRSQSAIRELEKQYGLTQLQSSWVHEGKEMVNNFGQLFLVANEVDLPGELENIIPADHLFIVYANPQGEKYFLTSSPP